MTDSARRRLIHRIPPSGRIVIVALLVLACDQAAKAWLLLHIATGESRTILPHLLEWSLVENTRGAYGLLGGSPIALILFSLIGLGCIAAAFWRLTQRPIVAIALGAVAGGACSNVLDRLRDGFVVDFIHLIPLPIFEVFNLADAAICLGMATLILATLRPESRS